MTEGRKSRLLKRFEVPCTENQKSAAIMTYGIRRIIKKAHYKTNRYLVQDLIEENFIKNIK